MVHACGDCFGEEKIATQFKKNARAKEIVNLFTYWLDLHSNDREMKQNILKLLIPFANSYDESVWDYMQCSNRIAECLMSKEWISTNKNNYLSLVTKTLIEIKIASKSTLQDWNKYIINAIESRNNQKQILCLDYLTKLCIMSELAASDKKLIYFDEQKRKRLRKISVQIEQFIERENKIKPLLQQLITKSKNKIVRDCTAKFICAARNICWNSTMDLLYTKLSANKTAQKSLVIASNLNKKDMMLLQDNIVKITKLKENRKRATTMRGNIKSQLQLRQIGNNKDAIDSSRKYNELLPDPIKHLTKTWWYEVSSLTSYSFHWKKAYIAVQTLMVYSCGNLRYRPYEDSISDVDTKIFCKLPKKIKDNQQSTDILDLFGQWISWATHIPTRKLILRLLVVFANSFKRSKWINCKDKIMKNLICKQYNDLTPGYDLFVTNALIAIYVNHKDVTLRGSLKGYLVTTLNSNNPKARMSVLDYLSKLCVHVCSKIKNTLKVIDDWDIDNHTKYSEYKQEAENKKEIEAGNKISADMEQLFNDNKFRKHIKEIICSDIDARVRINAAKFIYGAKQICWGFTLDKLYKKLLKHKIASISINIAPHFYKLDKESLVNNYNDYEIMKKYRQLSQNKSIRHVLQNNELIQVVYGYCHRVEQLLNKYNNGNNMIFIPNEITHLCVLYAQSGIGIVNIAVGQCGIQISKSFYELLLKEYDLDSTGRKTQQDNKYVGEVFLKENSDGRAVARSFFIDTEPGMVDVLKASSINGIILPGYTWCGACGVGNNWGKGYYTEGLNCLDYNKLRYEIEKGDEPQGIQLIHSLGGGTGSGLGSFIMRKCKELFPNLITTSISIFPSKLVSDVVVEPYNAIFTLSNMFDVCDCTFVIDNGSLFNIWMDKFNTQPYYSQLNFVASQMISDVNSLFEYNDSYGLNLSSFVNKMIKYPKLKYLNFSRAPFYDINGNILETDNCNNDSYSLVNKLFEKNNRLYSKCNIRDGVNLSTLFLYRGINNMSNRYIQTSIKSVCNNLKSTMYFDNDFIYTQIKNQSSIICNNVDQIAMIVNSTSITQQFKNIILEFDKMYKRKAFLHWYKGEGMEEDEFVNARSTIQDLIDDYNNIKNNF